MAGASHGNAIQAVSAKLVQLVFDSVDDDGSGTITDNEFGTLLQVSLRKHACGVAGAGWDCSQDCSSTHHEVSRGLSPFRVEPQFGLAVLMFSRNMSHSNMDTSCKTVFL
jgi:hypothetical protein